MRDPPIHEANITCLLSYKSSIFKYYPKSESWSDCSHSTTQAMTCDICYFRFWCFQSHKDIRYKVGRSYRHESIVSRNFFFAPHHICTRTISPLQSLKKLSIVSKKQNRRYVNRQLLSQRLTFILIILYFDGLFLQWKRASVILPIYRHGRKFRTNTSTKNNKVWKRFILCREDIRKLNNKKIKGFAH